MSEKITVGVTKYALTGGIFKAQGNVDDIMPKMFDGDGLLEVYHGDEWHLTPELAREKAEKMRVKKIASLEKSLAKMKALKFEVN